MVVEEYTWYSSPRLISSTGASCIMRMSIASIMSSYLKSAWGESLYMSRKRFLIPSSSALKSNGVMIP
nr:betaV1 protein [Sida yellow mosaic China satellite DNA beta]